MFAPKYKELNIEVHNAYKEIKKLKLKDELAMEKVLKKHYDKIQNQKSNLEFTEFLKYRYNYLHNDLSMVLSVIFLFASTCIPPICLSIFGNNYLKGIENLDLAIAILKALGLTVLLFIIISIISSAFLAPYIILLFPNKLIKMRNTEIKFITTYMEKDELIDYIGIGKSIKEGLIDSLINLLLSFFMWVLISKFLS